MERKRNRAYHAFFEGYTEYYDVLPDGKKVIRRVYTGTLYAQDKPWRQRIIDRCMYAIAFFLSVGLFILAAKQPVAGNTSVLTVIFTVAAVFAYIWLFIALLYYYPMQPRTIYAYHTSHDGIVRASFSLTICHGAAAIMHLILFIRDHTFSILEGKTLLYLVLSLLTVLFLFLAERGCPYLETNASQDKVEGTYIR